MSKKLYASYGSNTNIGEMSFRTPNAKIVGVGSIEGYKLSFSHYLNITKSVDESVQILVWEIDEDDEISLDQYEGYPYLYYKEYLGVKMNNGERLDNVLVYIMSPTHVEPNYPTQEYVYRCMKGYKQNNMDLSQISKALEEVGRNKKNEK